MIVSTHPNPWRDRKPPLSERPFVDWTHPLARGLNSVLYLTGPHRMINDLIGGQKWRSQAGPVMSGAPSVGGGAPSLRFGLPSQSHITTTIHRSPFASTGSPGSIAAVIQKQADIFDWAVWCQGEVTDNNYTWGIGGHLETLCWLFNGVTTVVNGTNATVNPGWNFIGGSKGANAAPGLYANGKWDATSTVPDAGSVEPIASIGSSYVNGSLEAASKFVGLIDIIYIWQGRVLTKGEFDFLYQNPYALIRSRPLPVLRVTPAAGGGTTIPVFRHHYQMQGSA